MKRSQTQKIFLLILALVLVGIGGWIMASKTEDNENSKELFSFEAEDARVEISPIQCGGNPWEVDWQNAHPNETYPTAQDEKNGIIMAYYTNAASVAVKEVKQYSFAERGLGEFVCAACSCPAGYILSLRVPADDLEKMLELGFAKSAD